jgi:hypothetical protein
MEAPPLAVAVTVPEAAVDPIASRWKANLDRREDVAPRLRGLLRPASTANFQTQDERHRPVGDKNLDQFILGELLPYSQGRSDRDERLRLAGYPLVRVTQCGALMSGEFGNR